MPDFFKDFLHQELVEHGRNAPPTVHLAAFGKHPAWNDHMEDINLNTLTLLEAKRYIYLQGISGNIDSGAWNPPAAPVGASQATPSDSALQPFSPSALSSPALSFNHWLLWHRPGEILLGRLLASTDGKGRTRYPFVVLAHIINLPLASALETCAPLIDEAARQAREATTPDAVRQIIVQTRSRLAAAVEATADSPSPIPPGLRPAIDPSGWTRLYHVIENQLHQYGPGARPEHPSCRHLRLPSASGTARVPRADGVVPDAAPQNLLWWAAYWLTQLDTQIPLLLIAPETAAWLDLIVGEPASQHFRCLLVDSGALPTVTDTPYSVPSHIEQVTNELLLNADESALPARSLFHLKPPTRDTALAIICTRDGLAKATRPPGLLKKLFG
ncbi:hypothetical protein M2103_000944 [Ereboglobus sp. PH5-5]|uniref:hypothetical protein n=1 Tax=Ereboglobus sp. PH5-5 TaxID=2940529 RepID=UPI00240527AF|nr:hypothetical protein [Ereboglobus sp. PH5-5]MDF9832730.1 hypothetical protein [Ereboglobus sp. PH5-5]